MKPVERVELFIKELGLSISEFERVTGMSNNSIGAAIRRKTSLKDDTLNNILKQYPDLSARWLLLGEGDKYQKEKGFELNDIEILKYIHKNLDRFKKIPSFKKLFDVAYWQEQVEELEKIKANAIEEAKLQGRDKAKVG